MTQHKSNQGSFMGIVLIIIGALFLLNTFTDWSFGYLLADWWPLIFIVIAIVKFQNQERGGGLMFLILGGVFLLFTLDILEWGTLWRLWPVILIFIGLSLIFKGRNGSWGFTNDATYDSDFIQSNAIFSGAEHRITSQNFKGGETMALFGGVENKSRGQSEDADKIVELHCTVAFGGIDIK